MELLSSIALVAFAAGYLARATREVDNSDAVDQFLASREQKLRERYTTTAMDYVTFGDEIALVEDPDTERIMRAAVAVEGIGPKRAFRLARRFDSYDTFRSASADEYAAVNGIGQQRGAALSRVVS